MKTSKLLSLFILFILPTSILAGEGGSIGTAGGGNLPTIESLFPREIEFFMSRAYRIYNHQGRELWERDENRRRVDLSNFHADASIRVQAFGAPPRLTSWHRLSDYPATPRTYGPNFSAGELLGEVTELQVWLDGAQSDLGTLVERTEGYRTALLLLIQNDPTNAELMHSVGRFDTHFFLPFSRVLSPALLVNARLPVDLAARVAAFAPILPTFWQAFASRITDLVLEIETSLPAIIDARGLCSRSRFAEAQGKLTRLTDLLAMASAASDSPISLISPEERSNLQMTRDGSAELRNALENAERLQTTFQTVVTPACPATAADAAPSRPEGVRVRARSRRGHRD
jgi:hypothetical protein